MIKIAKDKIRILNFDKIKKTLGYRILTFRVTNLIVSDIVTEIKILQLVLQSLIGFLEIKVVPKEIFPLEIKVSPNLLKRTIFILNWCFSLSAVAT